jgi:hypothetical protein
MFTHCGLWNVTERLKEIGKIAGCQGLIPVILAYWETEMRRTTPQANCSRDPHAPVTRAKWIGGMTQEVEHQLCKHKALTSNPSPTKKRKRNWQKNSNFFFFNGTEI